MTTALVRQAPSYPAFLRAARLYIGGFLLIAVPVVLYVFDLGAWFLLASAAGIALVVIGAVLARDGYRRIERELSNQPIPAEARAAFAGDVRSVSTLAAFQDLVRRR